MFPAEPRRGRRHVFPQFSPTGVSPAAHLATGIIDGQFDIDVIGEVYRNILALGAISSFETFLPGDSYATNQVGNPVATISWQTYWLTSGTVLETSARGSNGDPVEPVGIRHAIAEQVIVADRTWGTSTSDDYAGLFMQRTAFEPYLSSPHRMLGFAVETRHENVGCYAPFIDLRASAYEANDTVGDHYAIIVPVTLAIGFNATENTSAFFQYGIALYTHTGAAATQAQDLFELSGTGMIHRFRFGAQYDTQRLAFALYVDLYRGMSLYDWRNRDRCDHDKTAKPSRNAQFLQRCLNETPFVHSLFNVTPLRLGLRLASANDGANELGSSRSRHGFPSNLRDQTSTAIFLFLRIRLKPIVLDALNL